MKNYETPAIIDEVIVLEDIIAVSNQGAGNSESGDSSSLEDLFPQI